MAVQMHHALYGRHDAVSLVHPKHDTAMVVLVVEVDVVFKR